MLTEVELAPALVDIVIGLLAAILFLAGELLKTFFNSFFTKVPVVGKYLVGAVDGGVDYVNAQVDGVFSELTRALARMASATAVWSWHFVNTATSGIENGIDYGVNAGRAAANALASISPQVAQGLLDAEGFAQQKVDALSRALEGDLSTAVTSVRSEIESTAQSLRLTISTDVSNVKSDVDTLAGTLRDDVSNLLARMANIESILIGDVGDVVTQLEAGLASAEQDALRAAAAAESAAVATAGTAAAILANTAVGTLDQAAHDLVIGPWTALLPDLTTIIDAIPLPDIGAINLPALLDQVVPISIPGILALLGTASVAVAREVADCVVPNCGAMSGLQGLLSLLTDAAGLALLLAFLEEVASNPGAAVQDVRSELGDVVDVTASAFRGLIGL